jgi:adenosylhomocysteine nucleosidase
MSKPRIVVLISAGAEWRAVCALLPQIEPQSSPLGEWFVTDLDLSERREPVVFFHGGWGKIAAAASAQYVIDRWSPALLVNLGTCGGFESEIERGDIILVERTIVYDIVEQMTDPQAAIAHYTTDLDLSWLGERYPQPVRRTLLVSADRDLIVEDIPQLKAQYGAAAGDWESGAIAWVATQNDTRCLILRGVTDLVGASGGEAYNGNKHVYHENARAVMEQLVRALPAWLTQAMNEGKR